MNQLNLPSSGWQDDAAQRVIKLYPNQGMHDVAITAVMMHPRMIEYLELCPAAIISMRNFIPSRRMSKGDNLYLVSMLADVAAQNLPLKKFLAKLDVPLQARQLKASVVSPSNIEAIRLLKRIPPSDLAQAIPEKSSDQRKWLNCIKLVVPTFTDPTVAPLYDNLLIWIAKIFGRVIVEKTAGPSECKDLLDWFFARPAAFHTKMTYASAMRAVAEWHEDLAREDGRAKFERAIKGVKYEEEITYYPWPDGPVEVNGLTFKPLRSGFSLHLEGVQMKHCVATYAGSVINGSSRIFSILNAAGKKLATMEIVRLLFAPLGDAARNAWRINQVKARYNHAPPQSVFEAADAFFRAQIGEINGLTRKERMTCDWRGVREVLIHKYGPRRVMEIEMMPPEHRTREIRFLLNRHIEDFMRPNPPVPPSVDLDDVMRRVSEDINRQINLSFRGLDVARGPDQTALRAVATERIEYVERLGVPPSIRRRRGE